MQVGAKVTRLGFRLGNEDKMTTSITVRNDQPIDLPKPRIVRAKFDGVDYTLKIVPDYGFGSIVRVYDVDGFCVRVFDSLDETIWEMRR